MEKRVELLGTPMFYLSGRREFENLKTLNININGIALNYSINKGKPILKTKSISISNEKAIKKQNNDILVACVNLGEFVNKNRDILNNFATCYLTFKTRENLNYIKAARPLETINSCPSSQLKGTFYNLDVNKINSIDFSKKELEEPKYATNKTLLKLLIKWLIACGISEEDSKNIKLNNFAILPFERLLQILDISLEIYKMFMKCYTNKTIEETIIKVDYKLIFNNDIINIERSTDNLLDYVKLLMISYSKNELKSLRVCEYCNGYFFGRKNKKCCSTRCKDLKNGKH